MKEGIEIRKYECMRTIMYIHMNKFITYPLKMGVQKMYQIHIKHVERYDLFMARNTVCLTNKWYRVIKK